MGNHETENHICFLIYRKIINKIIIKMKLISFSKNLVLLILIALLLVCTKKPNVIFSEKENQIDIFFNKRFFTSYHYSYNLVKLVFLPIHSPSGTVLTRGYPFEEIDGESRDHPHHTGMWFTCDDVNGNHFWNNTEPPPQILHDRILKIESDRNEAVLSMVSFWNDSSGKSILEETRTMVFSFAPVIYTIDFTFILKALDITVVIRDTKEGLFAIRVADWLNEKDGSGKYANSKGEVKEAGVWGKRANWMKLEGKKEGKTYGIVIMNHPNSINYPTYWMARGYGLFSANPLGQLVYQQYHHEKEPKELKLTLSPQETATFKFRMVIYEGLFSVETINELFADYVKLR